MGNFLENELRNLSSGNSVDKDVFATQQINKEPVT